MSDADLNMQDNSGINIAGETQSARQMNQGVWAGRKAHPQNSVDPLDLKPSRFEHAKNAAILATNTSNRIWYAVMLEEAAMARSEDSGTFSAMEDTNERRLDAVAMARLAKDAPRNVKLAVETVENVSTAFMNIGRYIAGHETKEFQKDETLTQKRMDNASGQPLSKSDVAKFSERFGEKTVESSDKRLQRRQQTLMEENAALKREIDRLSNPAVFTNSEANRIRKMFDSGRALNAEQKIEIGAMLQSNSRILPADKEKITEIISRDRKLYPFEVNKLEGILTQKIPLSAEDKKQIVELMSLKSKKDKELRDLVAFREAKKQCIQKYGSVAKIRDLRKIETILGKVDKILALNEQNVKAAMRLGYDPSVDKKLVKAEQKVYRERHRAAALKQRISEDYARGAKLSSSKRKALMERIREKQNVDQSLRRSIAEYRALRLKKQTQAGYLPSKRVLTPVEKKKIEKLKENLRLAKSQEKLRRARRGKYQLKRSLVSLASSATRESEEAGVQGLMRANRMIQSRFAQPVLIHMRKTVMSPVAAVTKPLRPIISSTVSGIDRKLQATQTIKRVGRDVGARIKYSRTGLRIKETGRAIKSEINGGIYHRVKRRVVNVAPKSVKETAAKAALQKRKSLNYVANKRKVFERWQRKTKAKIQNSFVGRAYAKVSQAFKKISHVFRIFRAVLIKGLSFILLALLVAALTGAVLASIGGTGFSLVMEEAERDGKIDISEYGNMLKEIQEDWYKEFDEFVAKAKESYYEVHIEYLNDAATNNFKEMISMAAVYFGQDLENKDAIKSYLKYLYGVSHYYETTDIGGISCDGCTDRITYCEGCVSGDYGSKTCPGHTETVCPGNHVRLNIEIMVLGFDDIFWADDYAGSGTTTTGGMYKGELIGENFEITGYCSCTICCGQWSGGPTASGVMPKANHTIAVDPDVIPLGTHVIINGKEYVAEDIGGAVKGNHIDIYFGSHQEALSWGKKYYDVYYAVSEPDETPITRRVIDYNQYALSELKVFMASKNIVLDNTGSMGADEFTRSVAALKKYDEDHTNEKFTTAELNAFTYVGMSQSELRKLCKERDIAFTDDNDKTVLARLLVGYDLEHPDNDPIQGADEITPGGSVGGQSLEFAGWTEDNIEWAKEIYSNMTSEYYYGLEGLGGSYGSSDGFSGYEITEGSTSIIYYSQYDSRWKDSAYSSSTIGKSGCCPTSMAMIVSSLSGTTVDPVQMSKWAADHGYYISGVGTSWSFVPAAASNWGLSCQQVSTSDVQTVLDALSSGKLVIMSTGPGTYYQGNGHFLVLRGVAKDGMILVADPASEEKTQKAWPISDITSGLKAWWVIGQ